MDVETDNQSEVIPQSLGGKARAQRLSPKERSLIAQGAAEARWRRRTDESEKPVFPKATHDGELKIGEIALPCAVLDDGTRVISERGVTKALGGKRGGSHWRRKKMLTANEAKLPVYLSASNLKPFISNSLETALNSQIIFKTKTGGFGYGVAASLLPEICEVLLKARESRRLHPSQEHLASQAELLMRGLAHVGIIALVDEATGYQEIRDRLALQKILEAYVAKELAAWAKRFPDAFYKELFRLRGWQWKGMSVNRPSFVGKLTNDLVYERLAPGILEELKRKNPKVESGYRRHRFHQYLTDDVGHPALAQHLHATIAFMKVSSDWKTFYKMIDRAFPRKNDTIALALED
jgi:hypothetical protein